MPPLVQHDTFNLVHVIILFSCLNYIWTRSFSYSFTLTQYLLDTQHVDFSISHNSHWKSSPWIMVKDYFVSPQRLCLYLSWMRSKRRYYRTSARETREINQADLNLNLRCEGRCSARHVRAPQSWAWIRLNVFNRLIKKRNKWFTQWRQLEVVVISRHHVVYPVCLIKKWWIDWKDLVMNYESYL